MESFCAEDPLHVNNYAFALCLLNTTRNYKGSKTEKDKESDATTKIRAVYIERSQDSRAKGDLV